MADNTLFAQLQDFKLAGSGVGITDVSITFQTLTQIDGTLLTMADFGVIGYMTMEPGTSREEQISFAGITQNANGTGTITGVIRGLEFVSPYTQDLSLRKAHAGSSISRVSNTAAFYTQFAAVNNEETILEPWIFNDLVTFDNTLPQQDTYVIPTINTELVPKQYVDDAISAVTVGAITAFAVQQDGADPSLNVTVGDGWFMVGNQPTNFVGASGIAMTPSSTNFVQLDATATVVVSTVGYLQDHLPLATVSTDVTDITAINDDRSWLTLASDDQIITRIYLYGDTIAVGDVLYLDTADAKWKLADASTSATADPTYGIALDAGVDTDTDKRVQLSGVAPVVTGVAGTGAIFLSDTPGNASTAVGTYRKTVGFSPDGTTVILDWGQDPTSFSGASTNVTSDNLNTLVDNDDATGLHFHTSGVEQFTAGETINGDPEPQAVYVNQISGEVFVADPANFGNGEFGVIGTAITDATASNPVDVALSGTVDIASKTLTSGIASHPFFGIAINDQTNIITIDLASHATDQGAVGFLMSGQAGNLSTVEWRMVGSVGNSVDVTTDIFAYDTTNGEPTGSSLGTSDTVNNSSSSAVAVVNTFNPVLELDPNQPYVAVVSFSNYVGASNMRLRGATNSTSTQQRKMFFPDQFDSGGVPKDETTSFESTDSGASWSSATNAIGFQAFTTEEQFILGADLFLDTAGATALTGTVPVGKLIQDTKMEIYNESKLIASDTFRFIINATSGSGSIMQISVPSNSRRIEIDILEVSGSSVNGGTVTLVRGSFEGLVLIGDYEVTWDTDDFNVVFDCISNQQTVDVSMRFYD